MRVRKPLTLLQDKRPSRILKRQELSAPLLDAEPQMPEEVARNPKAAATWNELIPQLMQLGVLAKVDEAALSRYVIAHRRWL